ncbi:hypothetical protein LOTGIDRAFT_176259, partial [Lottia gigantea]
DSNTGSSRQTSQMKVPADSQGVNQHADDQNQSVCTTGVNQHADDQNQSVCTAGVNQHADDQNQSVCTTGVNQQADEYQNQSVCTAGVNQHADEDQNQSECTTGVNQHADEDQNQYNQSVCTTGVNQHADEDWNQSVCTTGVNQHADEDWNQSVCTTGVNQQADEDHNVRSASILERDNLGYLPAESNVKEADQLPVINNPEIFIKKYHKKANDEFKLERTYDRRHSCKFCGKLMTNIQSHLEHAHKNSEEIKQIFDIKRILETVSEEENSPLLFKLNQLQTLLRNQGNHNHNTKVCQQKKGEIILSRRRESETFDLAKYGPCPRCMEWIIFDNLTKHKSNCPLNKFSEADDYTQGTTVIQSKIMKGQIWTKPSKRLLKEVFPSMMRDKVTDVAQTDQLIVSQPLK